MAGALRGPGVGRRRPGPEGCSAPLTAGPPPRPTLLGGMAPGSGIHPVIRCRLLMLGLGVEKREKREER